MTTNEMGPADFRACTCNDGNGNGWGGEWGAWIILFLIFGMFGWGGFGGFGGGFGGGGAGFQGALTRGDLCMDMNFSDLEGAVRNLQQSTSDGFHGIDNAVCTLGYQNAQLINGVQMQVANEFRGLDNAVCNLGFNVQQGQNALARQLADCCCTTQQNIKDNTMQGILNTNALQGAIKDCCCENEKIAMQNRFDMQQYNCSTMQAIDKLGDRIEARLTAQEMAAKDARIQEQDRIINSLNLMQSQANQTADIRTSIMNELRNCPVGTYNVPNPNCCYGPWGGMNWTGFINSNNGCGNSCGNNCGNCF